MAQPDRLEGAPDAAVGVDGVERQLQPAAVSQRVAASKAAAEKRTAKAMSADERAIKRRADQRLRRAKASDRGEQHGRATAVEGKQHSPAEAEETVESAVEHLGLPPLTAVRPDARASAAVMAVTLLPPLSLPPPPQPPAQRTATERAAAERAAKKVRRAERDRQMCAEGERALWLDEAARSSLAWRRISDPSSDDDDDLPSALRAHPGDSSSDVYERWCDYGHEFVRSRPYRPQMPPKPPPLDVARQPNLPPDLLALALNSLAGKYYVGERNAAGQCDGRGKYVFAEGAVFEGDFKAGKPEGRIIYRSADGDVYEGDFKAGEKDGRGIYWSASGAVYEGEFKAGKPEGRGIYWSADGDVYEGEFKADKRDHDETNRSLNRSLGA